MKNTYTAPTINIEHYELSQAIAACSLKIGLNSSACVISDPDTPSQMKDLAYEGFFNDGACNMSPIGMDSSDGVCYHTSANVAFTS